MTHRPATLRVLFCGDRQVSVELLRFLTRQDAVVVGLGVNRPFLTIHADEIRRAAGTSGDAIFHGRSFVSAVALAKFRDAEPDLGICCGFDTRLPGPVLEVPRWGWVNIHRSYLPLNRGLDPLHWALIDQCVAGVSLHVMTAHIDDGPVIEQAEVPILPNDTGHTLSARADAQAFELFESCWPRLRSGDLSGTPQDESLATYHSRIDCEAVRRLDPSSSMEVGRLLRILRAYGGEGGMGAYFTVGPVRYRINTTFRPAAHKHVIDADLAGATVSLP